MYIYGNADVTDAPVNWHASNHHVIHCQAVADDHHLICTIIIIIIIKASTCHSKQKDILVSTLCISLLSLMSILFNSTLVYQFLVYQNPVHQTRLSGQMIIYRIYLTRAPLPIQLLIFNFHHLQRSFLFNFLP